MSKILDIILRVCGICISVSIIWHIIVYNSNFFRLLSSPSSRKSHSLCPVKNSWTWGFLGGAVVKNPPANAGDTGSSPGPGRSHMPRSN